MTSHSKYYRYKDEIMNGGYRVLQPSDISDISTRLANERKQFLSEVKHV